MEKILRGGTKKDFYTRGKKALKTKQKRTFQKISKVPKHNSKKHIFIEEKVWVNAFALGKQITASGISSIVSLDSSLR